MLTLLSPAKKLASEPASELLPPSRPQLMSDTGELVSVLKKLSQQDIQKLMQLSDSLAELNYQRFADFRTDGRANSARPAIYSFNGNVYQGLDAASMDKKTLQFAQNHLRILSGLYGVLRPLDLIQPYRLEMGTKLQTKRGGNLYRFWGSKIAKCLNADLAGHKDKTVINLASNEYIKAVDKKILPAGMIEVKFLNIKDGQARNLMYYAKRARGQMARWIMQNFIENSDDLRGFDMEDYRFDEKVSTEDMLVFSRRQPAPKNRS